MIIDNGPELLAALSKYTLLLTDGNESRIKAIKNFFSHGTSKEFTLAVLAISFDDLIDIATYNYDYFKDHDKTNAEIKKIIWTQKIMERIKFLPLYLKKACAILEEIENYNVVILDVKNYHQPFLKVLTKETPKSHTATYEECLITAIETRENIGEFRQVFWKK